MPILIYYKYKGYCSLKIAYRPQMPLSRQRGSLMQKSAKQAEVIEINGVKASPYVSAYLTPEEFEKAKEKIAEKGYEVETLKSGKIAVSKAYPSFRKRIEDGLNALSEDEVLYYATSEYITSEFRDVERAAIMSSIGLEPEKVGRVSKADKELLAMIKEKDPEKYAELIKTYNVKVK